MLLFCPTMHFASGVFAWAFLQVRRKTSQFVAEDRCVFREISSNRRGCVKIASVLLSKNFKTG